MVHLRSIQTFVLLSLIVLVSTIKVEAKTLTQNDLKDASLRAYVSRVETLVKKLSLSEKQKHAAYARLHASFTEIDSLESAIKSLTKKGDTASVKQAQAKQSKLRVERNKVYLGLWEDIGEKPAKVVGTYGLALGIGDKQLSDSNLKQAVKVARSLAEDPLAKNFSPIEILMHALSKQMSSLPGTKH